MTTADLAEFFMRKRALPFIKALALAESCVIRHTLKPEKPADQLTIPFAELRQPHLPLSSRAHLLD